MSWRLGKANQAEKRDKRDAPLTQPSGASVVSVRWLLSAITGVVLLAAVFAYATLGLLFYQGQWQFMLHPQKAITATPHESYEQIHFDYSEEGLARLSGWWIPAGQDARWGNDTVLYLHGGAGSLSNYVSQLDALHALGVNVFAFDYRGYGMSAGLHPDEQRMTADANAAWDYLTSTRHEDGRSIVIYGTGVGASLAAELAARHTAAGLVLDGPTLPARQVIGSDARAKILPMWLLLTQKFDPSGSLKTLKTPKLFLDRDGAKTRTEDLFRAAAQPKEYLALKQDAGYGQAMQRFLWDVLTQGEGGRGGNFRRGIP